MLYINYYIQKIFSQLRTTWNQSLGDILEFNGFLFIAFLHFDNSNKYNNPIGIITTE